jgi:hypothetical protein
MRIQQLQQLKRRHTSTDLEFFPGGTFSRARAVRARGVFSFSRSLFVSIIKIVFRRATIPLAYRTISIQVLVYLRA